jgi:hypothetical protein
MLLNGVPVITSEMYIDGYDQISKRKHRAKRIQKKWNKKYGFYLIPIPSENVFIFNGKIMGHPKTIKKMLNKINKQNGGN